MSSIDLEIWRNHFEHHVRNPTGVPRDADLLALEERRLIARSIAIFQRTERSKGRTLLRTARRFAQERGVPMLLPVIGLLIREERRHAALLRAFMDDHDIALARSRRRDRLLRLVGLVAGLEIYLHVLICAELIGIQYCRALGAATRCRRLAALTRVLASDELAHVGFELQLAVALREHRAAPLQGLQRWAHHAYFVAAVGVAWMSHRPVLRQAGYDAHSFLRACRGQYAFYLGPVSASRGNSTGETVIR